MTSKSYYFGTPIRRFAGDQRHRMDELRPLPRICETCSASERRQNDRRHIRPKSTEQNGIADEQKSVARQTITPGSNRAQGLDNR
jgi:hypothetical protein